jgi:hypothetical protein
MRFVDFQTKKDKFNIFGTNIWHENIIFFESQ